MVLCARDVFTPSFLNQWKLVRQNFDHLFNRPQNTTLYPKSVIRDFRYQNVSK